MRNFLYLYDSLCAVILLLMLKVSDNQFARHRQAEAAMTSFKICLTDYWLL